jgi:NADH-quinone oxidoreductase subunit L
MSPLFELSDTALSFIIVIGSITALFMGFLGIIQNDIKRVVAYSTLSQLGYMTVALGVSAYNVAVFHLMTHAFFKALLFLGAGSVIIGMHHDQDMRNMGGLRKYMPITWITSLLGSLALIGTPFFSGFYSKDSIIEAVHESHLWGSGFAYFAVVAGVFITAFYSFRMYFLVFHGKERFGLAHAHDHHDDHAHHADNHAAEGHDPTALHEATAHHEEDEDDHGHHGLAPGQKPHESPLVVTLPLILLAIPSVIIGFLAIKPMLFGDFFKNVIYVNAEHHPAMEKLAEEFHSAAEMGVHAFTSAPFWLALAGVVAAYYCYMINPRVPAAFYKALRPIHTLLDNKYYMDKFNEVVFAGGARGLGKALWQVGDRVLIDGLVVNGSAKLVGWFSSIVRTFQTGYIYHYAFVMILGVLGTLLYFFPFWHA